MDNLHPIEVTHKMKVTFHQAYQNNHSKLQAAITDLKESGFSHVQSLFILMSEVNMDFQQANMLILNSEAWNK